MSQITWADKTECVDINNPQPNETLTPAEVNEIRDVVNGKEEVENKATDFSTKNDTLYPTTLAVSNLIGTYPQYIGTLDGSEDLTGAPYITCGYFTPVTGFNATDSSYPTGLGTKKPFLVVYEKNGVVLQILYVVAANDTTYSEHWFRSYNPFAGSGEWGLWTKALTADKIVTSISSPTDAQIPTALAIQNYFSLAKSIFYKTTLAGNENLNDLKSCGFYISATDFTATHASYPCSGKGLLAIYSNDDYIIQRYTTINSDGSITKEYVRSGTTGDTWGAWVNATNGAYVGDPSITADSDVYRVELADGSTDDNGKITVTKLTGEAVSILTISMNFNKSDDRRIAVQLTPCDEQAFDNKSWVYTLAADSFTFKIGGGITDDTTVSFYYSVFKK